MNMQQRNRKERVILQSIYRRIRARINKDADCRKIGIAQCVRDIDSLFLGLYAINFNREENHAN